MQHVIEKEIEESALSIANQHSQCQWYVKTYLVAITGLFAIAAFFSGAQKLTTQATSVGVVYSLIVFFMGWGFLSVIAHKVSMIHMLYKHMAGMRELRIKQHPDINDVYVLPKGKSQIKYGSLIGELPYLFFSFNFVLFAGGVSYFLSPHLTYVQTVSTVSAICVLLGTFYPVVCISFKKHIACAFMARNMRHKNLLEKIWTRSVREKKKKIRGARGIILFAANVGAVFMMYVSYIQSNILTDIAIVSMCYIGLIIYGLMRYGMERWRLKIGIESIHSIG